MYQVNVKERLQAGTRGGLASTLVCEILSVLTITITITTPLLTLFKNLRPGYMLIYLADFCSTFKILCKSTA